MSRSTVEGECSVLHHNTMISMFASPSLQRAAASHRGSSSTRRCNLPTASLPERSVTQSNGDRRTALLRFCVAHDMQSNASTSVVSTTASASEGMLLSKRTLLVMSAMLLGLSDSESANAGEHSYNLTGPHPVLSDHDAKQSKVWMEVLF